MKPTPFLPCLLPLTALLGTLGCGSIQFETHTSGSFRSTSSSSPTSSPTTRAGSSSTSVAASGGGQGSAPAPTTNGGGPRRPHAAAKTNDGKALRAQVERLTFDVEGFLVGERVGAIDAAKLDAIEQGAKQLDDDGDAASAKLFRHRLTSYRLENAWREDATKSGARIAELLGATVTTTGQLTDKNNPVSFSFAAAADQCYVVLAHLAKSAAEQDGIKGGIDLVAPGAEGPALEHFRIPWNRTRGPAVNHVLAKTWIVGACATKATPVTVKTRLQYAGSDNALRYVVVESTRAAFSPYLMTDLEVRLTDTCDVDNWVNLWTHPIPGSVLYENHKPVMPSSVDDAENLWMTAYTPSMSETRVRRTDVTSTPPSSAGAGPSFTDHKCPRDPANARSVDGVRVAQCFDRLATKYGPMFDAAASQRDNARTPGAYRAAVASIDRIQDASDAEVARTCGPMEAAVMKRFHQAYDTIVDFYGKTPYQAPFDRGTELGDESRAGGWR